MIVIRIVINYDIFVDKNYIENNLNEIRILSSAYKFKFDPYNKLKIFKCFCSKICLPAIHESPAGLSTIVIVPFAWYKTSIIKNHFKKIFLVVDLTLVKEPSLQYVIQRYYSLEA